MHVLSPMVKITEREPSSGARRHYWGPIQKRYEVVQGMIQQDTEIMRKHRKDVLGTDMDTLTSDTYNLLAMCRELHIPYTDFKALPIQDRAKIIAQVRLDAMVKIVERHDEVVERNKEQELSKHKSKG